jgi:hypothetical protein
MLKKLAAPLLAGLLTSSAILAANIPLQTFWDPTNGLGTINALVQAINGGVTGTIATLTTAAVSSGTTIVSLFSATLPANTLLVGQTVHVKAIGVNSADANVKTVTFTFGNISCAQIVTGSGFAWVADFYVTVTAAATESSTCHAQAATTVIAPVEATNGAVAINAAIAVGVSGTAATAGTVTLNQAWIEVLR